MDFCIINTAIKIILYTFVFYNKKLVIVTKSISTVYNSLRVQYSSNCTDFEFEVDA